MRLFAAFPLLAFTPLALAACSSDSTTTPPTGSCLGHASGASASPKSGVAKVTSNVSFGGPAISTLAALDADVYATASAGTAPSFGGISFTAPPGGYDVLAKVKDKAEWLWLLEGTRPGSKLGAWKDGVVALLVGASAMKVTSETGAPGPTIDPSTKLGLLFLGKGKADAPKFLALPTAGDSPDVHLAVTREGAIFVSGKFADGASFGGVTTSCGGAPSLVRYDAIGQNALWARCVGKPGSAITVESLGANATSEATITGFPGANPDFDLGPKAIDASAGGSYVVSLDSLGKTTSVAYTLRAYANVVVTEDGTRFFIGDSPQTDAKNGLIEYFGATYLPCSGDGFKTIVSRMNPDGKIAWTRAFGGQLRLAVLPDKRAVLFHSGGEATIADGLTVAAAGAPALIVVDAAGNVASAQTLGEGVAKNQIGLNVFPIAATSSGVWLGGMFDGTLTLKTPLTSANAADVLINVAP